MKPLSFLLLGMIVPVFASAAETGRPNVILVMSDDQGWNQTGYAGHPHLKTPHLDQMAAQGIRFNRFYAAAPVCSPTRASVLTGRTPARTGVPGLHKRLCLQEKTISQALKKAGYATAHFGKWHLGGVKGSAMPILPDDPNRPELYGFDVTLSATNYIEMDPLMTLNNEFEYLEGESSVLMVREALEFIKAKKEDPFFVVIWYGSPHFPYRALEKDKAGFPEDLDPMLINLFAEIVAMDRSVGMLRQGLRDLKLADDTLIWFCSDNGGRDHDPDSVAHLRGHKGSLYEGGIRVPGIIEWPGRIKPTITDSPASTMDIMPTLVDLLDLPKDSMLPVVDGESIMPLLEGKPLQRTKGIPFSTKGRALIDGRFKLVQNGRGKNVSWELYDLEADPRETKNLAKEDTEQLKKMIAELEKATASIEASAEGKDYPEGRVLQPQRGEEWSKMPEYRKHYETFQKLKPGWTPPSEKKPRKKKKLSE